MIAVSANIARVSWKMGLETAGMIESLGEGRRLPTGVSETAGSDCPICGLLDPAENLLLVVTVEKEDKIDGGVLIATAVGVMVT